MKKILIALLAIGCVVSAGYYEHHYTRKDCEVVQVNDGFVTIKDSCGYYWDFEGDGFNKGDVIDVVMFDSCTPSAIQDDEIIRVKATK